MDLKQIKDDKESLNNLLAIYLKKQFIAEQKVDRCFMLLNRKKSKKLSADKQERLKKRLESAKKKLKELTDVIEDICSYF